MKRTSCTGMRLLGSRVTGICRTPEQNSPCTASRCMFEVSFVRFRCSTLERCLQVLESLPSFDTPPIETHHPPCHRVGYRIEPVFGKAENKSIPTV